VQINPNKKLSHVPSKSKKISTSSTNKNQEPKLKIKKPKIEFKEIKEVPSKEVTSPFRQKFTYYYKPYN
jgi:hypothetical protein